MSLNSKALVRILKLLLVIGLFSVIFYNISLTDSITRLDSNGAADRIFGEIIGPWDQNPIRFRADGTSEVTSVMQGPQVDGATLTVSPGLPTYVRNLDGLLFLIGAILFFCFVVTINSRWWFLLRANGLGVKFFEAQKYGWIGMFFNNVLPGATGGDVAKAVYIVRRCSGDKVRAVVSILIDRIIGVVSLILVGSLASLLAMDRFPVFASTMWLTGLGVFAFCLLLVSPGLRRLVRFEFLVSLLPSKVGQLIREVDQAVLHYRGHLWGIGAWVLASPLIYTLFIGSFFCMSESLGVGISLADLFFIVPVASVIQGIPIAPAGWGIGEAAYGALIGKFGAVTMPQIPDAEQIMRTRGVALSVIHRVQGAMWSLLGGLAIMIDRREHPSEKPLEAES